MARERVPATKEDWETMPMPEETATFKFRKHFEKDEIEKLKFGHIPEEMEDRWFCYFEDDTLRIYRSWSGICVYIVRFRFKWNIHTVTVNRNKNQYAETNIEEDREQLEELLRWWS